ncbi:MAG: L7Ae/L30e/S12e/Gadd45 family ribosomal protein [Lachnospiraceae bacterium]
MNQSNKILSILSLATKAGKTVSGEFSTETAIKSGKACLVLVADDASANTKKMFTNMCSYYKVPLYIFSTKLELGHCMGKEKRASMAITDVGFADAVKKKLVIG